MHIPDGFINAPTAVATAVLSGGTVAYALRQTRDALDDRRIPLVGLTAAFVFAVQMVNFPVLAGTSGHLLGGALAAILLGPWLGLLVLAVVLLVQAIGFADGGITALGANVSWAVIGAVGGYVLFRALAGLLPRTRTGFLTAVGVTAWSSVVLASGVVAAYLVLNGFDASATYPAMLGLHALIGLGEAAITVAVVAAVVETRPDLLHTADLLPGAPRVRRGGRVGGVVLVGLGISLLVAMGLSYLASGAPDGLEAAVLQTACEGAADPDSCLADLAAGDVSYDAAPLPDYALPGGSAAWLAGGVGVLATFAVGAGLVRLARAGSAAPPAAAERDGARVA